jgi:hypothetical protein
MAYKEVITVGSIEWAKVFENNRDMKGFDDEYAKTDGAYVVDQVLSKEEYAKLTAAGSQKKPKQKRLMDGEIVITYQAGFGATLAAIPPDLQHAIIDQAVCAFDLRAHGPGSATRTMIEHLGCFVVIRAPGHLSVIGPRSSAASIFHALETAARSAF